VLTPDVESASVIMDRVTSAGPDHFATYIEEFRQAFMAEREVGRPSAFWAFMAVAASAARDVDRLDGLRQTLGLSVVRNYASEVPTRTVEIPVWAAAALFEGWARATSGPVRDGQAHPEPPLPFLEAFGLGGEGGDRTVGRRHILDRRNRSIALEVENLLARNPGMSSHAAHHAIAEKRTGVTPKTVERAHKEWGTRAKSRLAHFDILGQPMSKS
jgi:hypothetical protein